MNAASGQGPGEQVPGERLAFALRGLHPDDWNCILKSWMRSYRATRPNWRDYYERKHEEIELYRKRGADFIIACDPEDPTTIFGWACVEAPVVHFVYVKPYYRGQGIARSLVTQVLGAQHPVGYTHRTETGETIAANHPQVLRLVTLG